MTPETLQLQTHEWVPNNARFPIVLYRGVVEPDGAAADALETLFSANNWPPRWRNGIYRYHHYHSTAHEVLGIASGSARVILGGPGGEGVELAAGDVVLLPAGTGHCLIEATADFLVVGAYPPDADFDICRKVPTPEMSARIATLPRPGTDPVGGAEGAIMQLWPATP